MPCVRCGTDISVQHVQSNKASAAALKNVGTILAIRYRALKQAQRPGAAAKLAKKAARQGEVMRERLGNAFLWYQQAARMISELLAAGTDLLEATLEGELPAHTAGVQRWLSNQWLQQHAGVGADLSAAVHAAANTLLGGTGIFNSQCADLEHVCD